MGAVLIFIVGILSLILLSFNIILQSIGAAGSWALFGIICFYLLTSVPTFQGVGVWISRGLSFWKKAEKSAVALKIQQSLNSTQEELNSETKGLFPYPAKVEWVEEPSYLNTEEECVIIRMKEHEENPRNVAYAIIDYVSNGMIPYSKLYLKKPIRIAIDSVMIKKILLKKNQAALDYFMTHVLNNEVGKKGVPFYIDVVNSIDKHGLFTRIYLEEIREIGLELYPTPNPEIVGETRKYLIHLKDLATREHGELNKAEPFIGKSIKVGYVLVADIGKLAKEGFRPYIQYALRCIKDGVDTLYLLARDNKIAPTKYLASKIGKACKMDIINISEHEEFIDGKQVNACVIELKIKKDT